MVVHSLKTMVTAALVGIMLVALSGCGNNSGSGGNEGPETYIINSGTYEFTPTSYEPDTCWSDPNFPPLLPLQLAVTVDYDTGLLTLAGTGIAEALIPPIDGTISEHDINAGPTSIEIDARESEEDDQDYTGFAGAGDCYVIFSAIATGTVTKNNAFDAILEITISEKTEHACDELIGDTMDMGIPVPFPAIDKGACSLNAAGTAVRLAD